MGVAVFGAGGNSCNAGRAKIEPVWRKQTSYLPLTETQNS